MFAIHWGIDTLKSFRIDQSINSRRLLPCKSASDLTRWNALNQIGKLADSEHGEMETRKENDEIIYIYMYIYI